MADVALILSEDFQKIKVYLKQQKQEKNSRRVSATSSQEQSGKEGCDDVLSSRKLSGFFDSNSSTAFRQSMEEAFFAA